MHGDPQLEEHGGRKGSRSADPSCAMDEHSLARAKGLRHLLRHCPKRLVIVGVAEIRDRQVVKGSGKVGALEKLLVARRLLANLLKWDEADDSGDRGLTSRLFEMG